jgi:hypothetical protein
MHSKLLVRALVLLTACISLTITTCAQTGGSPKERLAAESPTRFFVLDGPQELQFDIEGQKASGVEFITPMGHHALKRSEEHRK